MDQRLIDANAYRAILMDRHDRIMRNGDSFGSLGGALRGAIKLLDAAPTVDGEPVRHAHWVDTEGDGYDFACSACGGFAEIDEDGYFRDLTYYCPRCNAIMDEVTDNEID